MPAPPPTLSQIFRAFLFVGLTAFGGEASIHVHHAVVRRHGWMSEARMLEGMAVARVLPGTNASNLAAFTGALLAGYRGAVVAVVGLVTPGVLAVLGLAIAYARFAATSPVLRATLHGLGAGAVGIMGAYLVTAVKTMRPAIVSIAVAVAAFVAVGVLQWNAALVIAGLLPIAMARPAEATRS